MGYMDDQPGSFDSAEHLASERGENLGYTSQQNPFTDDKWLPDSELDSDDQYKAWDSSQYQIGDLFITNRRYERDRRRFIVLAVFGRLLNVVEEGKGFTQHLTGPYYTFSHKTGLAYQYESKAQVQQDYQNGFFTPYFATL